MLQKGEFFAGSFLRGPRLKVITETYMAVLLLPRPRLELKYRISEATASAVREFIRGFLEADRYAADQVDASYTVTSCYLDSSELHTFWHTVKDSDDRYKLRIRTYGSEAESPVFLEIKRRVEGMIVKSRACVRRASVPEILAGRMPEFADMATAKEQDLLAAERFVQLMVRIQATPTALVRYEREAWGSPDQTTDRLTMDRQVCWWPTSVPDLRPPEQVEPTLPFGETVILEMKFSDGKPHWFRDLERVLGLRRTAAAKYCEGFLKRGIEGVSPEGVRPPFFMEPGAGAERARSGRFGALFRGDASSPERKD